MKRECSICGTSSVCLSLGSNLGESSAILAEAVKKLAGSGLSDIKVSSIYLSSPLDCPPGSPDFYNMAMLGTWRSEDPFDLLKTCRRIEKELGRRHEEALKNAPRSIDIDIVLFGSLAFEAEGLLIPHPRAAQRLFVLLPLREIAGDIAFPGAGGKSLGGLIAELESSGSQGKIVKKTFFPNWNSFI